MALQPSGTMSIGGPTSGRSINLELGRSATASSSLGESALRTLAEVPSGAISMSDFYGASSFSASGGNVNGLAPGNGYNYHTFTSPGTFTISSAKTVEVLMVAGGGTGGSNGGGGGCGGGGAGGLLSGSLNLTAGSYPINVGATSADSEGTTGNPTTAFSATATGGGAGGRAGGNNASAGGSGGGGSAGSPGHAGAGGNQAPQSVPYGTLTGYGFGGGTGTSDNSRYGGGGGGAGEIGGSGPGPGNSAHGGSGRTYTDFAGALIGVPALSPLSGAFAGGGGGGRGNAPPRAGGGRGSDGTGPEGTDALSNTGSGGGGASKYPNPGSAGGTGASGIVVIRYQ